MLKRRRQRRGAAVWVALLAIVLGACGEGGTSPGPTDTSASPVASPTPTPVASPTPTPAAASLVDRVESGSDASIVRDLHLPDLTGPGSEVVASWRAAVDAVVEAKEQRILDWQASVPCEGADCPGQGRLEVDWRGDVLGDAYASAVLISQNDSGASGIFEADADTITLDVRSGRLLGLSDVVAEGGAGADVLREALSDGATACGFDECEDPCPVADADFPRPADWAALTDFTVTAEGVTFWFDQHEVGPGACGVVSETVAWPDLEGLLTTTGEQLREAART